MLALVQGFWSAVAGTRVCEIGFHIFQIGIVATLWSFIGGTLKVMQKNVVKLITTSALL